MEPRELKPGDVVQIHPDTDPIFGGAFMMVEDPKSFGCQGYVLVLPTSGKPGGRAYYRCEWEKMEYIGRAEFVPLDVLGGKQA